jgi:NCS1 family nucleobase:cation symporter-1
MVDYYAMRKQRVDVVELFREDGRYAYRAGWNPLAVAAFVVGAVPATQVVLLPGLKFWSPFSWFIGAVIGGLAYSVIARNSLRAAADVVEGTAR